MASEITPFLEDFFLPFLFTLAVSFGALQVSGVIKERKANLLIAAIMGFFAANSPQLAQFLKAVIPSAALFFIGFFFIGFIFSFVKGRKEKDERDFTIIAVIFALLLLVLVSGQNLMKAVFSESVIAGIGLALMLMIIYAAYNKGIGEKK